MKFIAPNYNPGPGTYLPEIKARNSSPGVSIGKSERKPLEQICYTDQYYDDVNLYESPKISIGKSIKDFELKKSKLPGPGTYELPGFFGELPEYALKSSK